MLFFGARSWYTTLNLKQNKNLFSNKNFTYNKLKTTFPLKNPKIIMKMKKNDDKKDWYQSILSNREKTEDLTLENWKKTAMNILQNTPFPSQKDESWKLTDLSKFFKLRFTNRNSEKNNSFKTLENYLMPSVKNRIIFINGEFQAELSSIINIENQASFLSLNEIDTLKKIEILESMLKGESGMDGGFFSILNIAFLKDVFLLNVFENMELDEPIHIIFFGNNTKITSFFNTRLIIMGEANSSFNIIQHHCSNSESIYFENSSTTIRLKEKAKLEFSFVNEISLMSTIISSIHADLEANSNINFIASSFGGFMSRISLGIDLNGKEANCEIKGVSITNKSNTNDFHSRISHNYPNCRSSQFQKNLVSGKGRSIFAGKIQVQHGSSQTEADQLCKTLLLSSDSRIDSLPILEINNEDVKCTHGSTVSDLDQNQIFYFQSRGISDDAAKFILTIGFIQEINCYLPIEIQKRLSGEVTKII
jgi:Fe-S cluster assembly protein SufD